MFPMRAQKRKEASHGPYPLIPAFSPVGEKVPGGRLRGIATGSWLRFTSGFWRRSLPMNPRSRRRESAHMFGFEAKD